MNQTARQLAEEAGSFEDFVAARSAELVRTGYLLTGDRHLAHDLVQTALVRVWPHWDRVRAGRPEAYVRRTMVNLQSSWWQRRWRGEISHADLPDRLTGDPTAALAERDALARALTRLTLPQRQCVVLRHIEDLSVEDVAETLGCSSATVKTHTARGLARLRDLLSEESGDV